MFFQKVQTYLYYFGKNVTWPVFVSREIKGQYVIGVLGNHPIEKVLKEIASKRKVNGNPIIIRRIATLKQYRPCHVLFLPKTLPQADVTAAIKRLYLDPVLLVGEATTVAEVAKFTNQGGTICLRVDQAKVRIHMNIDAIRRNRLSVDAKLLKMATIVKEKRQLVKE